jgi:hypothetical protein
MDAKTFFDKLGGRKFVLGVLSLLALVVLATVKPTAITPELITGILGILGLFNATNAATSIKAMATQKPSEPTQATAPQVDLSPVVSHLEAQQQQINSMADIILHLTSTAKPANVGQAPTPERTQPNGQAQANREAISDYLTQNFGR